MSQKRAKQIRRQVKRAKSTVEADMIDRLLKMPWKDRIAAAWIIARGKR